MAPQGLQDLSTGESWFLTLLQSALPWALFCVCVNWRELPLREGLPITPHFLSEQSQADEISSSLQSP